jgi:hypothetical protein
MLTQDVSISLGGSFICSTLLLDTLDTKKMAKKREQGNWFATATTTYTT